MKFEDIGKWPKIHNHFLVSKISNVLKSKSKRIFVSDFLHSKHFKRSLDLIISQIISFLALKWTYQFCTYCTRVILVHEIVLIKSLHFGLEWKCQFCTRFQFMGAKGIILISKIFIWITFVINSQILNKILDLGHVRSFEKKTFCNKTKTKF